MNASTRSAQRFVSNLGGMIVLAILAAPSASAQITFATIHEFTGTDGASPVGNLVSDSAGNFYGAATLGGLQNTTSCILEDSGNYCGTLFKLSRSSAGKWQESVLHEFTGGSDGGNPLAGLTIDAAGNLYGTTVFGGLTQEGVVFELSPTATGPWTETVLYSFLGGNDGSFPEGVLVFDKAGNLYGTTFGGGTGYCGFGASCGTIFELSKSSSDIWSETVIYNFASLSDGANARAGMIFDSHGNLYGTTANGGNTGNTYCGYPYYGCGTVFELMAAAGTWNKTTLYIFNDSTDGAYPDASLIFDSMGNLYGTAAGGGDINGCEYVGCGVVFKLTPNSSGAWNEVVLHAFKNNGSNVGAGGGVPVGSLIFDSAHNLYGTAAQGGTLKGGALGDGVIFKLSPTTTKAWQETVLHTFSGSDGAIPSSGLLFDSAGDLLGTTNGGGILNGSHCSGISCGVVFEIKP